MADKTDEYESPASLYWILEDFVRLRAFFRTTQALRRKVPLHDWTTRQLEDAGYLGSWTYSLYKSSLAGLPAVWIATLFPVITPQPGTLWGSSDPLMIRLAPVIYGVIFSFYVPLLLTLFCLLGGWAIGGLGRKNASQRSALIRVYLYEDGRLGWMPQAFFALMSVYLQLWLCCGYAPADIDYSFPMFSGPSREGLLLTGWGAYFVTTLWLIPLSMLRSVGSASWFRRSSAGEPPKAWLLLRYQALVGIGGTYLAFIGAAVLYLAGFLVSVGAHRVLRALIGLNG